MVNDSQAFILFTYKNLQGFLMFKLLLMRQTLFDFDVLSPWNLFVESLARDVSSEAEPGEVQVKLISPRAKINSDSSRFRCFMIAALV